MNNNRVAKPEWLKINLGSVKGFQNIESMLKELNLKTVCKEANCPNRAECYSSGTATFLIMGGVCTRKCKFCNVKDGSPKDLDSDEPKHIAEAVKKLKLNYVVVTSVTRDDLADGGASHFAKVIREIRKIDKDVRIEVLIPDLKGREESLKIVLKAMPEVLNHNIETIPRLYDLIRPEAEYNRSLDILKSAKTTAPKIKTKSGIMLGLGETREEVIEVFKDLREHSCDLLTIGQYLRPSAEHYPVYEYVTPEEFEWYKQKAEEMGFENVASGPLVRSSYKAWQLYND
ncbi:MULTISPECIES: lipoyl synthase [Psychrilyobacter]|uniref:Lipoyl synthase n=1 Tax=Psychrilyobacter piezotolerans TaxID=2293438 RepID=A0ABX9KFZ7_9FUSO|nr:MULTISPECIES: lipoyl synthase [Psychrilyobacter]MCS5422284.1 lipoyl synthase [Psychrilyobacter sp. S5]NDI78310.1 lipoyl synthase [Psychrilyobacter piezotolerans]RDE60841.1 lipoyl synthase [Psychrilyobacter sp. S5]REI40630.1 lipoyl synthase [Psychrilyobacter piezotolerans]